jgi:hypothetical protein
MLKFIHSSHSKKRHRNTQGVKVDLFNLLQYVSLEIYVECFCGSEVESDCLSAVTMHRRNDYSDINVGVSRILLERA